MNEVTYQEAFEAMQALYNGNLTQQSIAVEFGKTKLYTTPPQRTWVGLTKEEVEDIEITWEATSEWSTFGHAVRYIEALIKEKNT